MIISTEQVQRQLVSAQSCPPQLVEYHSTTWQHNSNSSFTKHDQTTSQHNSNSSFTKQYETTSQHNSSLLLISLLSYSYVGKPQVKWKHKHTNTRVLQALIETIEVDKTA